MITIEYNCVSSQVIRPYNFNLGDILFYSHQNKMRKDCEIGYVSRIAKKFIDVTTGPANQLVDKKLPISLYMKSGRLLSIEKTLLEKKYNINVSETIVDFDYVDLNHETESGNIIIVCSSEINV